jgi:antitoxin component of RelBE/YafQ-DinJ toxin-antitoxin module
VLEQIGMDMPTAVRIYLNKIVQTRSIPFTLEAHDVQIEPVEVDVGVQEEMDAVAKVWRQRKD